MRKILSTFFLTLAAAVLLHALPAQACPGCNVLNGDLGLGFNTSILFMMAMPFTVVGGVAAGIILLYRQASQTRVSAKRESQNPTTTTKETGN